MIPLEPVSAEVIAVAVLRERFTAATLLLLTAVVEPGGLSPESAARQPPAAGPP
ncbi:hypothetical protein [Streptomyces sp. NPDC014623]|uniref:hypothetical protein n=1 Tax=Streptomyces sp. NPDC014623 TaxID=3364875 RepID=UPI0036FEDC3D